MSEKSDWEKGYDQAMMRTYGERKALKARIAELEAENAALKAKLKPIETVDEWGKPDWVGKDVRK